MKKVLLVLTLLIVGCVNKGEDYSSPKLDYVTPNVSVAPLPPPECKPEELGPGFREGCLLDIRDYNNYLERYLKEAHRVYDVDGLVTKMKCEQGIMQKPYLNDRPTISDDANNKTPDELITIVTNYTKELQDYNSYVINTYVDAIDLYNSECKEITDLN